MVGEIIKKQVEQSQIIFLRNMIQNELDSRYTGGDKDSAFNDGYTDALEWVLSELKEAQHD